MKYRSEIDGLRAVAVVPVIMFHAGFATFGGGYVGVDVFFVISGYLICTIIISEMEARTFSLLHFYERRARRILPALLFVALCCIPAAWLYLLPTDMDSFAKSLIAVATFSSNLFFLGESGYFQAEAKPLLHTWSLAVEEQFYILFPLLLLYVRKFGKYPGMLFLVIIFGLSLSFAQWAAFNKPSEAFFLLQARAWELLIGVFAAFYFQMNSVSTPNWINNALSALGLTAILYSVFAYSEDTPFPGFYALVPTLGTLLVILFAQRGTLVHSILSLKWFVGFGLISYSLYLWHQPIFAFFSLSPYSRDASTAHFAFLSLLSVLCAWLTFRYVEQPFRRRGTFSGTQVFLISIAALAGVASLGAFALLQSGFPNRYNAQEREFLKLSIYRNSFKDYGLGTCFLDYGEFYPMLIENNCVSRAPSRPQVFVFGDSEAAHLMVGIRESFGATHSVEQWTGASCRPFLTAKISPRCAEFFDVFVTAYLNGVADDDILIIAGNWSNSLGSKKEEFESSLRVAFEMYSKLNLTTVVVGDLPNFGTDPLKHLVARKQLSAKSVSLAPDKGSALGEANRIVGQVAAETSLLFVNPSELFCVEAPDLSCVIYEDGIPNFFDRNHLSHHASSLVGAEIRAILD